MVSPAVMAGLVRQAVTRIDFSRGGLNRLDLSQQIIGACKRLS